MSKSWREIQVDVEARGKEFRLGLDREATGSDVLAVVEGRCKEEGVDIEKWARHQVGRDFQYVLLRKAEGNAVISPGTPLVEITPAVREGERFQLATQPVVGALPASIFNRRVECLVDDFYRAGLPGLGRSEGIECAPAQKKRAPGFIPLPR